MPGVVGPARAGSIKQGLAREVELQTLKKRGLASNKTNWVPEPRGCGLARTTILENDLRTLDRHSRNHILLTGDLNVDLVKYDNDI